MEPCRDRLMRDIRATIMRDDLELQVSSWMTILPSPAAVPENLEEACAQLAFTLQDEKVIEYLGQAWPRCLAHGRHPMSVGLAESGVALWQCPHDPAVFAPVGELRPSDVEEPYVSNGAVRWWADDLGQGVIADEGGDIWLDFTAIEMQGWKSLTEGQRVEFRAVPARRGAFRQRAQWVRPI